MKLTISSLLVDHEPFFLLGLRHYLGQVEDILVIAEASSAAAALEQARSLQPGAILLDLRLHGDSALEALPLLVDACRGALVALVETPEEGLTALARGARGVCRRDGDPAVVLHAVRAVAGGEIWVDAETMSHLTAELCERDQRLNRERKLTDREREVLALAGEGKTNEEIAQVFSISAHTPKAHVQHIMDKLGIRSRRQLQGYLSRAAERSRLLDACLAALGTGAAHHVEGRLGGGRG
jgi:DNA-binding NarL/FixJ family response regulator